MYLRGSALRYFDKLGGPSSRILIRPAPQLLSRAVSCRFLNQSRHEHREWQYGSHGRPVRSAVRPFTVLILCVPVGFAVRWAFVDENEEQTSVDGFTKYRLKEKETVSSTSSIFTLEPATSSAIQIKASGLPRAIESVQIKQPQLQIARNYTLLPTADGKDQELQFLIRKERNGEVSGYLHRLPVGSEIEIRGPVVDYVIPQDAGTVVFLAGGTGIAPAMQVAEALAGEADIHILWANRRREDCVGAESDTRKSRGWITILRRWFVVGDDSHDGEINEAPVSQESPIVLNLERLKQSSRRDAEASRLKTDYFVDEENTFITSAQVQRSLQQSDSAASGRKLLLVSGPDGFIRHWAGAKQWANGKEVQGPLGGVLSTINTKEWDVVKL